VFATDARAASFAVDIRENDSEYRIVADLPGVAKDAVSVQVENNVLRINAKTATAAAAKAAKGKSKDAKDEQKETVLLSERVAGELSRAFRLPRRVDAENINAALENGVLTITLPKAADAVSRKITVN